MRIVTVAEACERNAAAIAKPLSTCRLPLEKALGYVIAEAIRTPFPVPHFSSSAYDGYAFACPANGAQQQTFSVVGRLAAGEVFFRPLLPGEALRIMTGAKIPDGADTVAMFEQCECLTPDNSTLPPYKENPSLHQYSIRVRADLHAGDNVVSIGEEAYTGDIMVEANTLITGGTIAVLASLNQTEVTVYQRPRVAVLTSGRELQPLGTPIKDGTLYNSNGPMLTALLTERGYPPVLSYHVSDDPKMLAEEITYLRTALADIDIVISTGGVSAGDFDVMPTIFESLGSQTLYRRIAMRPGAAQYAGISDTTFFLGLSGNPSAAYNAFHLIGIPLLRHLSGHTDTALRRMLCRLGTPLRKQNPFDRYIQGHIVYEETGPTFYPTRLFTSKAILGLSQAQALYCMPKNHNETQSGDLIEVLLL